MYVFAVSGVAIISASPAAVFPASVARTTSPVVAFPASAIGSWATARADPQPLPVVPGSLVLFPALLLVRFFTRPAKWLSTADVAFLAICRAAAPWIAVSTPAAFDLDTFCVFVYGWRCRYSFCYCYFCFLLFGTAHTWLLGSCHRKEGWHMWVWLYCLI